MGTGVDLGQRNEADIDKLDIPTSLKDKLKPYTQKTGKEAQDFLRENPLNLSGSEASSLNKAVKQSELARLQKAYNSESEVSFNQLPPDAQTVIASVAYQYGDLRKATPNFWKEVTNQDWQSAISQM